MGDVAISRWANDAWGTPRTGLLGYVAQKSFRGVHMLGAGDSVPPFTLRSHDGESISLDELKGNWVVLHSFPFAFTGG